MKKQVFSNLENLSLFFILTLAILSCSNQQSKINRDILIDLSSQPKNKEFHLSNIASKVTYIPLETRPGVSVGDCVIRPAGSNFLVYQSDQPLMFFDKNGSFVSTIGNIGKGPGEYLSAYACGTYKDEEIIYILDMAQGKIHKYNFEGSFINSISLTCPAVGMTVIGNEKFIMYTPRVPYSETDKFGVFIQSGDSILKLYEPREDLYDKEAIRYNIPSFQILNEGTIVINNRDYRSLDAINQTGESYLIAKINAGRWQMPLSECLTHPIYSESKDRYIHNVFQYFTPSKLLIQYKFNGEPIRSIYDLKSEEINTVSNWDEEWRGIPNDIDNGPSFGEFRTIQNNKGHKVLQAIDLVEAYKENGSTQLKGELYQIVQNISAEDNPVIMVIEMK